MSATQGYIKPVPQPTLESGPYWAGLNEHKLMLQKCSDCGQIRHYPRPMCSSCYSLTSTPVAASGRGVVHSWTITHQAFNPGFKDEVPYTLATVDLPEGVRINTQLRGVAPEALRIGLPVRVEFETVKDGLTLPFLVPDTTA